MHFFGWSLASFYLGICFLAVQGVAETLILSKKLIELSLMSAILSRVVVDQSTKEGNYHETTESKFSGGNSFQATIISRYNDETNEALLATTKYGHCVLAFRGAPLNWKHWNESINLTRYDVCKNNTLGKEICCTTRQGFYNSYFHNKYFTNMEQSIRDCARKCPKGLEECVVLTGHDHGGAMAILAAISLSDINPHVLTFGQPPTLESPCSLIPSKRIYRFINTQETDTVGIAYDPIAMAPGIGTDHFGHMILLGSTGMAFLGLDGRDYMHPYSVGIDAHKMVRNSTPFPGYEDRIRSYLSVNRFPFPVAGYAIGSLCSEDIECQSQNCKSETAISLKRCLGFECQQDYDCDDSNRCDKGLCLPKNGYCIPCDEDSDCPGNATLCLLKQCSSRNGLMENQCRCKNDDTCDSGRCEGFFDSKCKPRMSVGSSCNEHSDCITGYCSWELVCEVLVEDIQQVGTLAWVLIGLVIFAGLFMTWKYFHQPRDGYITLT